MHAHHELDDMVRPATYPVGTTWPNIFASARALRPSLRTAAYYSWQPLQLLLQPTGALNASVLRPCTGCDECLRVEPRLGTAFTAALRRRKFELSFLHVDLLDECGHERGDAHPSYAGLVRIADRIVGGVLRMLREEGMLKHTTLLVMSSHGRDARTGKVHGGFTTAELAVQWLLYGAGVRRGQIGQPVSIIDSAPTLLHALGIPPPLHMHGRAVIDAFTSTGGPSSTRRALPTRRAPQQVRPAARSIPLLDRSRC